MTKYSSRVNPRAKRKPKAKKPDMSTQDQPSEEELFPDADGGALQTGGVLLGKPSSGGALSSGGAILPAVKAIAQRVIPKVKAVVAARREQATGGAILRPEDIDSVSYPQMIHALGWMDPPTFHILQGLAAAHLGQDHPLAKPLMDVLGGSFVHPAGVSRMATRDILKAATPQALSKALHSEWIDFKGGMDTGGGLFTSLKKLVAKGVSGGKKALSALASGAASAVRVLSQGAAGAKMVGKTLSGAIMQGVEIANQLQPAAAQLSPALGSLVERGVTAAEQLGSTVDSGVSTAGLVGDVLAPILGAIDAPLVGEEVGGSLPVSVEPMFVS